MCCNASVLVAQVESGCGALENISGVTIMIGKPSVASDRDLMDR